jgi:hypothetical protein
MRSVSLGILLSFFLISTTYAGGEMMPSYANSVYTEDGTHSGATICGMNGCIFYLDGTEKASYQYIDYPMVYKNNFYLWASDKDGNRYLLKDGTVMESWENAYFLTWYSPMGTSSLKGWYSTKNGTYTLKDMEGKVLLSMENAGTNSNSMYIASGAIQTTISNRSNTSTQVYINDVKITTGEGGYVQTYGTYKRTTKKTEYLFGITDAMWGNQLYLYDVATKKLRKLPTYDGISQVAVTTKKNGNIAEAQYVALVGDKYVFVDINGTILTKDPFDSVVNFTSYGDKFLKIFMRGEQGFIHYDGKTYGPYDVIETFNPSYGAMGYGIVNKWSIFVKKDGKNIILANGKEFKFD